MLSQLSEAEEQERVFSGKGRWNQVRSLADAKNLMNHLFNIASSSRYITKLNCVKSQVIQNFPCVLDIFLWVFLDHRCSLRDKEVICREKETEIRDLKEKVVGLSYALRQSEKIKAELTHKLTLQVCVLATYSLSFR